MEIPTARVIPDGIIRTGYAEARPYKWFTNAMGVFPGLEFSFRLTEMTNTTALSDEYGSNKDKALDFKYQLLPESKHFPALAVGFHDIHGTKKFPAKYITASRQIYPFDFTLGVGTDRLDGLFGGIEWAVTKHFHLISEYNPIDYTSDNARKDDGTPLIPEGKDTPFNFGIRYRPIAGLDLGITYQRGNKLGFTAHLEMDIGKELMPKKPDPMFWGRYKSEERSDSMPLKEKKRQWLADIQSEVKNIGMQDVTVTLDKGTLTVYCQNTKYLSNQKTVGRIYRIMLFSSPESVKELKVVLTKRNIPVLSASVQRDHFNKFVFGRIDEETLMQVLKVNLHGRNKAPKTISAKPALDQTQPTQGPSPYPDQSGRTTIDRKPVTERTENGPPVSTANKIDKHVVTAVYPENNITTDWGIKPDLDLYLNDPSGFFKFRIGASPYGSVSLWKGGFIGGRMFIPFYSNIESSNENVDDAVTSDAWKYKQADVLLERLEMNQVVKLTPRLFAMAGAGYFETMYAGFNSEILYFPGNGNLAVGLSYDFAIKRQPASLFRLMDFKRQTLFGNIYYNWETLDLKIHGQFGKFLAEDVGWKVFLTRSFDNGVDVGCWYSFTDTDHLSGYNRGYHDKGVFIAVPVRVLSPVEKRAKYAYAISPWTRDVAQTVYHWQSLYGIVSDLMRSPFFNDSGRIGE